MTNIAVNVACESVVQARREGVPVKMTVYGRDMTCSGRRPGENHEISLDLANMRAHSRGGARVIVTAELSNCSCEEFASGKRTRISRRFNSTNAVTTSCTHVRAKTRPDSTAKLGRCFNNEDESVPRLPHPSAV